MYKNYVFDFYGTLADIRTDEEDPRLWRKMSEIYSALGAAYQPEELQETFRRLEREQKERISATTVGHNEAISAADAERNGSAGMAGAENNGMIGLKDAEPDLTKVFAMLYEEKGICCQASQARMTAITFRALSRKFLRTYDGVKELLGELRRRGKGIYLLSNAQTDFTRPEIEMLGLTEFFDGIFISSEQGCKKPSPVFFERLLKRFGLDPSESIMIGNDEEADIAGANHVGMDSLYIHTEISPKEYGKVEATYRVMDGDFRKIGHFVLHGWLGHEDIRRKERRMGCSLEI